jgi:CTP synthase (UTP-ammonia lyase)
MDGALEAIGHARKTGLPFFGSCCGYQHAVLEFARSVLGFTQADNAEVNPDTKMPLVSPVVCALVEDTGNIELIPESQVAKLYTQLIVQEKYHCSYGINREYVSLFDQSDLQLTGFDQDGDPRVFELAHHPFFIGTAFQPERSALEGKNHPLITAFLTAAAA